MSLRPLPIAILLLFAAASTWWVVVLHRSEGPPPLIGPPRSDYTLVDFELIALDEQGAESFTASGPLLNRHPHLGTLDIEQPRFVVPDGKGGMWHARSNAAWVAAEANLIRLQGEALVLAPGDPASAARLSSEQIDVYPRDRRLASEDAVTVTGPGSILRGVGMRADLQTRFVELLSEVQARYEPPKP